MRGESLRFWWHLLHHIENPTSSQSHYQARKMTPPNEIRAVWEVQRYVAQDLCAAAFCFQGCSMRRSVEKCDRLREICQWQIDLTTARWSCWITIFHLRGRIKRPSGRWKKWTEQLSGDLVNSKMIWCAWKHWYWETSPAMWWRHPSLSAPRLLRQWWGCSKIRLKSVIEHQEQEYPSGSDHELF